MAEKNIKFISEKHKAFYMEKMQNAKFILYKIKLMSDFWTWAFFCLFIVKNITVIITARKREKQRG